MQVIEHALGSELRYDGDVIMTYSSDSDPLREDDMLDTFVTDLSSVSLESREVFPDTNPDVPVVVVATNNDDLLLGDATNNMLDGMGGNDRVSSREGDDIIFGRAGNDTLVGGAGADSLQDSDCDDIIYGDSTTLMDWI